MKDDRWFYEDFIELSNRKNDDTMVVYDAGFGIKRYTYHDAMVCCEKFMSMFADKGIQPGDSIVTILPNSPEAAFCFFAAIMMGIDYAPLPCTVTGREFNNWMSIVKPKLVIKKAGIAEYDTEIEVIDCNCDGDLSWIGKDTYEFRPPEKSSRIYLMTSGTTGVPKAMLIYAEGLWKSGKAFAGHYKVENSKVRFWNYLPMSYLGGLFNLALIPLCCEGSFVISEPFSGKTILSFWDFVKKHSITALWFVPSIVQGLLKLSSLVGKDVYSDVYEKITIGFLGTAPIALKDKVDFEDRFGIRLFEDFSLSETTFLTAETDDDIRFREQSSVGRPLPYISLKLVPLDDSGEICKIWAKTPFMFAGYLAADGTVELEVDEEGFFNTKDLGHFNDDGVLVLDGRDRDIIKKGGLFVSLAEIENLINNHPDVEQAAAVAIKHDFYGESYILFVKFRSEDNTDSLAKKLHLWMLDNIVSYKMPEKIQPVSDFPRTASGKIQKMKLIDQGN